MLEFKFEGVIVPLVSPLKGKNSIKKIDKEGLELLISHLSKGKADAIFINSKTGESDSLDFEKRSELVRLAVAYSAKYQIPVLAGITDNEKEGGYESALSKTLRNAGVAENAGASALVVCPYYYLSVDETNIERFIGGIISKTSLPIILYNNPGIAGGRSISVPIAERIAKKERVRAIKDSSQDYGYFSSLLKLQNENFSVFQGWEKHMLQSLREGAKGVVPSLANLFPMVFKNLCLSYRGEEGDRHQRYIGQLHQILYGGDCGNAAIYIKRKLEKKGIISHSAMANSH